jgi:hypothetical protein
MWRDARESNAGDDASDAGGGMNLDIEMPGRRRSKVPGNLLYAALSY